MSAKLVPAPINWRRAICDSTLDPTARLVALTLSTYMSDQGTSAFPGAARLSRNTGLSERAVRGALGRIVRAGFLDLVKPGGGRGCANEYRALFPSETLHHIQGTTNTESQSVNLASENPASDDTETLHQVPPISSRELTMNSPPTPAGRQRSPRDGIFDALVAVFGPARTRSTQAFYAKIAGELLEADATPELVRDRGAALAARDWPDAGPAALAKHWDALGRPARTRASRTHGAQRRLVERGGVTDA